MADLTPMFVATAMPTGPDVLSSSFAAYNVIPRNRPSLQSDLAPPSAAQFPLMIPTRRIAGR